MRTWQLRGPAGNSSPARGASGRVPTRGWPTAVGGVLTLLFFLVVPLTGNGAEHALVFQTDFGLKDGAVAAMRGVAVGVDPRIVIHDLSQENTPFNIWEGAYRLKQAAPVWPKGTVFVSVIDPGVGTARKSIVAKTESGHYFVTPDNGTLTLVAEELGLAAVREIDETRHRREGSNRSYTFHGRDIFALVGARLAAGGLAFEDVGPVLGSKIVLLAHPQPRREGDTLVGTIPFLDFNLATSGRTCTKASSRSSPRKSASRSGSRFPGKIGPCLPECCGTPERSATWRKVLRCFISIV